MLNGTLYAKPDVSIAREEPSAENDAAWAQYEKLGKDPETVARFDNDYLGMGDDAYMAQLDATHAPCGLFPTGYWRIDMAEGEPCVLLSLDFSSIQSPQTQSCGSLILSPLRAIWFVAFSWIVGGGPTIALVIIRTMLADLTTDSQRVIVFFRVGVMSMAASFVSSATSSALMTLNPWIPLTTGCGTVIIGLTFALFLPETMNALAKKACPEKSDVQFSNTSEPSGDEEPPSSTARSPPEASRSSCTSLLGKTRGTFYAYVFILQQSLVTAVLVCARFLPALARFLLALSPVYLARFNWVLARANLLVSF
ncbi:hypothetical protein BBP40_009112 [Aspergillus hancockii]|nr:hypothetical protein BBP40_009112 [Aspergillus hancockii]